MYITNKSTFRYIFASMSVFLLLLFAYYSNYIEKNHNIENSNLILTDMLLLARIGLGDSLEDFMNLEGYLIIIRFSAFL